MSLINSEVPQLDELSIQSTDISGTRVKYQCTYYAENTTVTTSSSTNLTEIFTSSDSIIPYLFPESANSEFYCYYSDQYQTDLSCRYEVGDKAIPVLPFAHLSSAGYLAPPGFLEIDSKNREYFEEHFQNFTKGVFESVEVTGSGILCEKLDDLQTPLELSKFAPQSTHFEKAYQFANGILGMVIIPLLSCLDRYLVWNASRRTSTSSWFSHIKGLAGVFNLTSFVVCMMNLSIANLQSPSVVGLLSCFLFIWNLILTMITLAVLSVEVKCMPGAIISWAIVLWFNRLTMFICSILGDSKNIYAYSVPYITYLIISPKAAGARVTDPSGFPVHLYFWLISNALVGVLTALMIVVETSKVGKTKETSLIRFMSGVWMVGTVMFEVILWNAHGTKLYQLENSFVNQVYLCWTQLCIITGLIMNIIIREQWASSLYDRLQETFTDITMVCSSLFRKVTSEKTEAAKTADASGFQKV